MLGVLVFMKSVAELNKTRPANTLLTVLSHAEPKISKGGNLIEQLRCICECGKEKVVNYSSFLGGGTRSCGCIWGRSRNDICFPVIPEIKRCWNHMIQRCYRKNCKEYKNYGAKGVVMCDEWKNDYQKFLDWSLVSGWKKGLNLDKDIIPKKLGIPALLYSPEMCCFVTPKENQNTKSTCRYYEYNGQSLNVAQICEITGKDRSLLILRLNQGMSLDDALNLPVVHGRRRAMVLYNGVLTPLLDICEKENVSHGGMKYKVFEAKMSVEVAIAKEREQGKVFTYPWKDKHYKRSLKYIVN